MLSRICYAFCMFLFALFSLFFVLFCCVCLPHVNKASGVFSLCIIMFN